MKLKTRLAVAFLTITIVPILLFYVAVVGLSSYQTQSFRKEYGLTEQVDLFSGNSLQIFNRLTKRYQEEIRQTLKDNPGLYEDGAYLNNLNEELKSHYAYLIVLKGGEVSFCGSNDMQMDPALYDKLPDFDAMKGDLEGGIYLDGENQHLIKQMDFTFPDGTPGSVFIVSNVGDLVPEVKSMIREMLFLGIVILVVAGITLTVWVYRSILSPLNKLQEATKQIKAGNLDFTLDVDADDEIGELCDTINYMSDEISRSERMKNDFISSVSHELRTPLTAIDGWSETLITGGGTDPEEVMQGLEIIQKESRRLTRMVEELLDFARIESGRMKLEVETFDLEMELYEAVYMYENMLSNTDMTLTYHTDGVDNYFISGDRHRMKQVFLNIIDNAAKYGRSGKRIEVELSHTGKNVTVTVRDFGVGIPEGELPFVKERFYKGSSKERGSGIGLAVTDEIVKLHGGTLTISSRAGQGTAVTVSVPAIDVHTALGVETNIASITEEKPI